MMIWYLNSPGWIRARIHNQALNQEVVGCTPVACKVSSPREANLILFAFRASATTEYQPISIELKDRTTVSFWYENRLHCNN